LIYSGENIFRACFKGSLSPGRVAHLAFGTLLNEDALSVYKIQSSYTIHMVNVSRSSAGSSSGSPSTLQQLPPKCSRSPVPDEQPTWVWYDGGFQSFCRSWVEHQRSEFCREIFSRRNLTLLADHFKSPLDAKHVRLATISPISVVS